MHAATKDERGRGNPRLRRRALNESFHYSGVSAPVTDLLRKRRSFFLLLCEPSVSFLSGVPNVFHYKLKGMFQV